jgi:hypothetical protein
MTEQSRQLALAYEKDYEIIDDALYEPLVILKNVNAYHDGWWNGNSGRKKVEQLIKAFKNRSNIKQACMLARISVAQYKYFCQVHTTFHAIKSILQDALTTAVKQAFTSDLLKPENAQIRERYMLRQEPEVYDPKRGQLNAPQGAAARITAEAFVDDQGNLLVSKQMSEFLDEDEDGNSQT